MSEERGGERLAIGILAFLMIMCGIGTAVCLAVGFGAYLGNISLGVYNFHWGQGLSIIIPGLIGIFVACACGCCNTRAAYIVNAVFDSLGLLALLGPIIYLWALDYLFLIVGSTECTTDVYGSCVCSNQYGLTSDTYSLSFGGVGFSLSNDCDRYKIIYACGVALPCMWAFGAIATIIHLVLVCHMACVMRETTPGHVLYAPGPAPIAMQGYPPQSYPQSTQPQQSYPTKGGY